MLQIGKNIFGIEDSYIHIGDYDITDKTDFYGDLNTAALNVSPNTGTQAAVYLKAGTSTQSASLLKTRTKTVVGVSEQIYDNNIIDKNGQLLVKVANGKFGNNLNSAAGLIPRETAGQIALYETASNTGIAILVQDGGALTWKYLELGSLP